MSLKTFHAVFIAVATALALFCAVQAFGSFRDSGSAMAAAGGVAALAAAVLLVTYETAFIRRCRAAGIR
jgi:hypothetical protein